MKERRFPLLSAVWRADTSNRFIIFPKAQGELQRFVRLLPEIREGLARWYGKQGHLPARQIQYEIQYFAGETEAALALAAEQFRAEPQSHTEAIFPLCMLFRCHLALGQPQKAEQCMMDIIRLSKAYPECVAVYQSLRGWANITTSWNGDSPRFYEDLTTGARLPVLEDRLEHIRDGSPQETSLEEPFVEYAERGYEDSYTLRRYYMNLFHAMYWLSVGDNSRAESYFLGLYETAVASGIVMPFIECGEQIAPLLRHMRDSGADCSPQWLERVLLGAGQYEEHLNAYRSFNP